MPGGDGDGGGRDAERLRVRDERDRLVQVRARRPAPRHAGALEVAPVAGGGEQPTMPRVAWPSPGRSPPGGRRTDPRSDRPGSRSRRRAGWRGRPARPAREHRRAVDAQPDWARAERTQLRGQRAQPGGEVGGVRAVVAMAGSRVEAGAHALDREQAPLGRHDVQRVERRGAPADRELARRRPSRPGCRAPARCCSRGRRAAAPPAAARAGRGWRARAPCRRRRRPRSGGPPRRARPRRAPPRRRSGASGRARRRRAARPSHGEHLAAGRCRSHAR